MMIMNKIIHTKTSRNSLQHTGIVVLSKIAR